MTPTATDQPITPGRVAVVGPGRLGHALAAALTAAGVEVFGPLGRSEPVPTCDAALLCVPDAEIGVAARACAGAAPLIGHTSGATPLAALDGARTSTFGLHPLQTFAGGEGPDRFAGAGCAVSGSTPAARHAARALALALGMRPFALREDDRAAYHAAASMASNFLVTLEEAAARLAVGSGLEADHARSLLFPLVRSTVENWAERGAGALTGPVARGDRETVARQRTAIEHTAPELLPLFDVLVERTEAMAGVAA